MKIEREGKPSIIIGKRVVLGQIVGAVLAWTFWIAEYFWAVEVPAAMVTQASTLVIGVVQIWTANRLGVTTHDD